MAHRWTTIVCSSILSSTWSPPSGPDCGQTKAKDFDRNQINAWGGALRKKLGTLVESGAVVKIEPITLDAISAAEYLALREWRWATSATLSSSSPAGAPDRRGDMAQQRRQRERSLNRTGRTWSGHAVRGAVTGPSRVAKQDEFAAALPDARSAP